MLIFAENHFRMNVSTITLDGRLKKRIEEFCSANGLDVSKFVESSLSKALNVAKYGETPSDNIKRENEELPEVKPEETLKADDETKVVEETKIVAVAETTEPKRKKITIKKK